MTKKKKTNKTMLRIKLLNKYSTNIEDIPTNKLIEFKDKIKNLTDTRIKKKTTYKIWDIVVVSFLATLANCNDWDEIYTFANMKYNWLRSFLKLTGGIPSKVTFKRVFSIIKPEELEDICVLFKCDIVKLFTNKKEILNFDGKTDNSSSRNENELRDKVKSLNVLNVYSHNKQMCIASEMIDDKTNEITAIPNIIKRCSLKDVVVTWDALNTQKANVLAVIKEKGDYVVALKANQGNLYNDVVLYFDEDKLNIIESGYKGKYLKQLEKSHSSIITYEYFQIEDVNWYSDYKEWAGLKSIGLVRKTIVKNNITAIECRYYISSLNYDIDLFARSIRGQWQVENNLHWHLDFTFKCDDNTTLDKRALFNLQILKKLSLSLLNDAKSIYDCSLKSIRFRLSLDFENEIIRFFNIISRH